MSSLSSRSRKALDPDGISGGGGGNSDIEQGVGGSNNNYYRRDRSRNSSNVTSSLQSAPPQSSSSSFPPQQQQQSSSFSYFSPTTTATQRQRIIIITLTLIKDTLLGSLLGILCLLTLFYLDYTNLISIGSTAAFQKTGSKLFSSDPTIITTIENSLEIKLLPRDTYDAMKLELSQLKDMLDDNLKLQEYTTQIIKNIQIKNDIQSEYNTIIQVANNQLGLEKWCGECKAGFGNCNSRLEYLKRNYGTGEVFGKLDIMKQGKCVRQ